MKTCNLHGPRSPLRSPLPAVALLVTAATALAVTGCSKSESSDRTTATAVPSEAKTIPIMGTPSAAPSSDPVASAVASPSAVASASPSAVASASPSAKPAASGKVAAAGAAGTAAVVASASAGKPADLPPLKPAASHLAGKNFTLDVASPGCRVDVPCVVTLRVAAVGDFHVNKEYPYKFTASAAPGVTFLGNGDANTFSRSSGDFHEDSEKSGTMTVRFKPSATGSANVAGTYKMSVCSAEQCQIETQTVALAVPVL